jgi:hypothetical protein
MSTPEGSARAGTTSARTDHLRRTINTGDGSLTGTPHRKSSFSGVTGCVEVAIDVQGVSVRDSKNRTGPALLFTRDEWLAFILGVQHGEFELPSL